MFLATTAIEAFWDTTKEILFLGEWCRVYSRKHVWGKLNHYVLPYHWDDREKLYTDYQYLDDVYERYLEKLAQTLNLIHQDNHPERYWRIIIGPWLFYFVEILFDRYESIRKAIDSGLVTETWITNIDNQFLPPVDFNHFFNLAIDDPYNHLLYSYIISVTDRLPYKVVESNPVLEDIRTADGTDKKEKKLLRLILSLYIRSLPESWTKFIFVHSYLPWKDVFSLQIRLGQVPCPAIGTMIDYPTLTPDKNLRDSLRLQEGRNEFEKILDNLIPSQIPLLYIEGYRQFKEEVYRHFPQHSQVIFTANAAIGIEAFKFWAAEQTNRGAKLVLSQHGGHHGMGKISAELKHEINISDQYFTWGWKEERQTKVKPMPSGQLKKYLNKVEPKRNGAILWVMMGLPRYSYWLYSLPIGPQMLAYLEDQKRFFDALAEDVKKIILIKPYMKDFGWNDRQRFQDYMPQASQYEGNDPMFKLLASCRLFIGTYNSTTYLETFVANFPTILFWNPHHWELRPEVQPFFNLLMEAGILYFRPDTAARKVNEIFSDPIKWWQSPAVQSAKDRFCREFAWTDRNWKEIWCNELGRLRN